MGTWTLCTRLQQYNSFIRVFVCNSVTQMVFFLGKAKNEDVRLLLIVSKGVLKIASDIVRT